MKTIKEINNIIGEYHPGDLVVHSAQVGDGKTSYMAVDAARAAVNGNNVLFCSFEINGRQIHKKINKSIKGIVGNHKVAASIVTRHFSPGNYSLANRLKSSFKRLKEMNKCPDIIYIDAFGVSMVYNEDYLYADALRAQYEALKELALELRVVIVVNTQMRRTAFGNAVFPIKQFQNIEKIADFIIILRKEGERFFVLPIFCGGNWKDISLAANFNFEKFTLNFEEIFIGIDEKTNYVISLLNHRLSIITVPFSHGRTILMTAIAEYCSRVGKRVVVLANEITDEFQRTLSQKTKSNLGNVFIIKKITKEQFSLEFIKEAIENYDADMVMIDDIGTFLSDDMQIERAFFSGLKELAENKNVFISVANQANRSTMNKKVLEFSDIGGSQTKVALADTVLSISRAKLSRFKRFMELLAFWKPKTTHKLRVLKNRTGSDGQVYLISLDCDKVEIKVR